MVLSFQFLRLIGPQNVFHVWAEGWMLIGAFRKCLGGLLWCSMSKDICFQVWWPEFNPRTQRVEGWKERTHFHKLPSECSSVNTHTGVSVSWSQMSRGWGDKTQVWASSGSSLLHDHKYKGVFLRFSSDFEEEWCLWEMMSALVVFLYLWPIPGKCQLKEEGFTVTHSWRWHCPLWQRRHGGRSVRILVTGSTERPRCGVAYKNLSTFRRPLPLLTLYLLRVL